MTPELVIFDCDGVLVDTEPTTDRVLSESLTAHGLPIAPHDVHTLFAGGTIFLVAEEARLRGARLPDDWVDDMYTQIFAALAEGIAVIPGVVTLIDALERAGIPMAIASNGPLAKMKVSLTPSGLLDRFAGRIYSGHDYAPKPAPDLLQHAMSVAGAMPGNTWMIDDMPAGWTAGQAAGCKCFAYVDDGSADRAAGFAVTSVTDMAQIAARLNLY